MHRDISGDLVEAAHEVVELLRSEIGHRDPGRSSGLIRQRQDRRNAAR